MVTYLDFYGAPHPASEVAKVFIKDGFAGPDDAPWEATIIAGVEYRLNLTPVVINDSGSLVAWPTVRVAHSNPAVSPASREGGRGVDTPDGMAELFTTTEAGTNGIQLGGGSKIGDGGPVDVIWIAGTVNGEAIRSEKVRCGLYSSDVTLSPVFQLRRKGATPVPGPAGAAGGALSDAQIAAIAGQVVRHLAVTMQAV